MEVDSVDRADDAASSSNNDDNDGNYDNYDADLCDLSGVGMAHVSKKVMCKTPVSGGTSGTGKLSTCETEFDLKWKKVMHNEAVLPHFSQTEVLRGFGVLMSRLSHLEEAQRRDRQRILFLEVERRTLATQLAEADARFQSSFEGCARLPGAPSYESVIDTADTEPRAMTIHELKYMEERLRKVKTGGKRSEECSKIMGATINDGVITWDIKGLPCRKQWQLFYYLFFQKVEVRSGTSLTERATSQARSVQEHPHAVKIAPSTRQQETSENSSDYDAWEEEEEEDEEDG